MFYDECGELDACFSDLEEKVEEFMDMLGIKDEKERKDAKRIAMDMYCNRMSDFYTQLRKKVWEGADL